MFAQGYNFLEVLYLPVKSEVTGENGIFVRDFYLILSFFYFMHALLIIIHTKAL